MTSILPATPGASPIGFRILALILPVLIGGQVFLAGLAMFSNASLWELHGAMGGALGLPILGMVGLAFLRSGLRAYRTSVLLIFVLYCLQFVFVIAGEGIGVVQALHPTNAVAITVVSVLLARSVWTAG
ncbi:putative membrane protein [Rhizobium petrolearium]|uniref:DUF6220 domain-containing protein n=1 Tax=Neorhizobium petrolearium TaxID=515361 RepID=UPI001AEA2D90|nr:DUF6220 domain-containing protein [Neorhizobium petrolearium]MBP1844699.1 putative membrane protein [Neorhizobium petrolearium]